MKSLDYTSEFPAELVTQTRGLLRLHLSSFTFSNKKVMKLCRYEEASTEGMSASFHPDIDKPPDASKWQEIFDRRFAEFEHGWPRLLTDNADKIAKRVRDWLPEGKSVGELLQSLQLRRFMVSESESVTLRFETSPLLDYHDLGVSFDGRNRIQEIEIEG